MPVQLSYTFLCCVTYKHYFLKTMFIYLYLCQSYKLLKEVIKWIWLQVDPRAESRLLTPSFLECPFDIPTPELFQPRLRYCETTWVECMTEPRVQALWKLSDLGVWVWRSPHLIPQPSLVCQFPYLLKLPPTSLEWSASFLASFMPSVYWSQFGVSPGKLSRLWANMNTFSHAGVWFFKLQTTLLS